MNVKQFLESTFDCVNKMNVRPRAVCKDGFSVSIQGGTVYHYCDPRKHCNEYHEVELGYPAEDMPTLDKYAEDKENHKDTVFAYVPIELIEAVIDSHGGIIG